MMLVLTQTGLGLVLSISQVAPAKSFTYQINPSGSPSIRFASDPDSGRLASGRIGGTIELTVDGDRVSLTKADLTIQRFRESLFFRPDTLTASPEFERPAITRSGTDVPLITVIETSVPFEPWPSRFIESPLADEVVADLLSFTGRLGDPDGIGAAGTTILESPESPGDFLQFSWGQPGNESLVLNAELTFIEDGTARFSPFFIPTQLTFPSNNGIVFGDALSVVPTLLLIPEPSTLFAGCLGAALLSWRRPRR